MLQEDITVPIKAEVEGIELAGNTELPSLTGSGNLNNTKLVNESLVSLNEAVKEVLNNFKVFSTMLKESNKNGVPSTSGNNNNAGTDSFFSKGRKYIGDALAVGGIGLAAYKGNLAKQNALISGDWLGADIAGMNATSSVLSGVGDSVMGASLALMPFSRVAGGSALILGGIAKGAGLAMDAAVASKENKNKELTQFLSHSEERNKLLANFGEGYTNDWRTNTSYSNELYKYATRSNVDTGLSDKEYSAIVSDMSKYGYSKNLNGLTNATTAVVNANRLAQLTGDVENTGAFAQTFGKAYKYGANISDINMAYAKSGAMGFNATQFSEFLTSIENAMEKGIEKGAKVDIGTFVDMTDMFSQLGGNNPFWKGPEAAARVQELRSGVQNATGLNSSTDMLLYQAFSEKGKSPLETLKAMESGDITPEILQKLSALMSATYGNDELSQVFALKGIFGSLSKASTMYSILQNADKYKTSDDINLALNAMPTADTENVNLSNQEERKVSDSSKAVSKIADQTKNSNFGSASKINLSIKGDESETKALVQFNATVKDLDSTIKDLKKEFNKILSPGAVQIYLKK